MTLRLIEGFDYLQTSPGTQVLGALGWSGSLNDVLISDQTAFGYGRCLRWTNAFNTSTSDKFLRSRWEDVGYIIGLRMNIPTSGNGCNLTGIDSSATQSRQWNLQFDQFGTISIYRYNNGVEQLWARTPPWVFVPGNWFYMEIKITPGYSTGGFLEIRINTVPVISLVNARTADGEPLAPATAPGITHLRWFVNRNSGGVPLNDWRSDDFYFLTQDGPNNNDYLGNVRAKFMPVIGNSSPLDWIIGGTAPAPTNWQSVINLTLDDSKYVYSSTVGDQDLYQIDPNLNTPTVFGVEVGAAYRMDDATQRFVANVINSGGAEETGSTFAINQSYTFYYDLYELDPDTGLGWTGAAVNALKVGPKVVG